MNLYFAPLACSLSARICLYEAGAAATFTQVNTREKRLADGGDFYAINALGQVPALATDEGELLTENAAVLQYLGERFPAAGLLPDGLLPRARLREWVGFIGTELHKAVFVPLLDQKAGEEVKAYARDKVALRMAKLEKHLAGREFLMERFSVADAYLATVLNWAGVCGVDLARWPSVQAYHQRMLQRPSVARAFAEEAGLFRQEVARATAR